MKHDKIAIKDEAIKTAIIGLIEYKGDTDFWSGFKIGNKFFDIHFLQDEDTIIYIYEVIDGTRTENEYLIVHID